VSAGILAKIDELRAWETTVRRDNVHLLDPSCNGVHESVLKSYQVLQFTLELLRRGVPSDVVEELASGIMEKGVVRGKEPTLKFYFCSGCGKEMWGPSDRFSDEQFGMIREALMIYAGYKSDRIHHDKCVELANRIDLLRYSESRRGS